MSAVLWTESSLGLVKAEQALGDAWDEEVCQGIENVV